MSDKGSAPDYISYIVRSINVPIEINYGVVNNQMLMRALCYLPLATENKEADYYGHLENYLEFAREEDIPQTGELLYVFYSLMDNFNEGEFEDFLRVA